MQGGGVHLHQGAGGAQEGLHLAGVQTAVRHLLPLGQQEDKVLNAHVQLAVPVVLQAVEFGVVSVAPAQLDGHAAVGPVGQFPAHGQGHELGLLRDVLGPLRDRGHPLQGVQQSGQVVAGEHLSVLGEGRIKDRLNGHKHSPQVWERTPANCASTASHSRWLMGKNS